MAGGVLKGKDTQHVLIDQCHNDVHTQGEMGAGGRRREIHREIAKSGFLKEDPPRQFFIVTRKKCWQMNETAGFINCFPKYTQTQALTPGKLRRKSRSVQKWRFREASSLEHAVRCLWEHTVLSVQGAAGKGGGLAAMHEQDGYWVQALSRMLAPGREGKRGALDHPG